MTLGLNLSRFRVLAQAGLWHTYTREAWTGGTEQDTYGQAVDQYNAAATGQRCRYSEHRPTFPAGAPGPLVETEAQLYVAHDDPLKPRDRVSAITDADGTVLLAGPVLVREVRTYGAGRTVGKVATLRPVEVRE